MILGSNVEDEMTRPWLQAQIDGYVRMSPWVYLQMTGCLDNRVTAKLPLRDFTLRGFIIDIINKGL